MIITGEECVRAYSALNMCSKLVSLTTGICMRSLSDENCLDKVRFRFARLERLDRSNSSNGKQNVQRYSECSHRKIRIKTESGPFWPD